MKNRLFTLSLLILPFFIFAQYSETIVINWLPTKNTNIGDYSIRIPTFNNNAFQFDPLNKTIIYSSPIKSNSSYETLIINNVTYENITNEELGDLIIANIPSNLNEKITTTISRDVSTVFLTFSPLVKDNFGIKKVTSISYSVVQNTNRTTNTDKTSAIQTISNSVLSSGNWYQFQIKKSGVYKISRSFLQQLGMSTNAIDPRRIKIYGNGGKMIPLTNNNSYPLDIEETPIEVIGENDGVFNNEDYILFYGEGTDTWNTESKTFNNLYEDQSYYYITTDGNSGKRIQTFTQPSGNPTLSLSPFDHTQFHELDKINIG